MSPRLPRAALLATSLLAGTAFAEGRTDGPEGSEVGHGGYESSSSGRFSLTADFGGAIPTATPLFGSGPPLYVGGSASFWWSDWFKVDLHGSWVFSAQHLNVFIGPRFSTWTWPISLGAGVHAGLIYGTYMGARFGISPLITADMMFIKHLNVGMKFAVDIPIGTSSSEVVPRIGIYVGWKF